VFPGAALFVALDLENRRPIASPKSAQLLFIVRGRRVRRGPTPRFCEGREFEFVVGLDGNLVAAHA